MGGSQSIDVNIPRVNLPDGYTAIVTGGHQGLGYEVSKYLALLGARVIIACEEEYRAKAAIIRIKADALEIRGNVSSLLPSSISIEEGEDDTEGIPADSSSSIPETMDSSDFTSNINVEYMKYDAKSFQTVLALVEKCKAKEYPINLLIHSDGIVNVPRAFTEDGNEMHLQVNYLSQVLLTLHLLPVMKQQATDCRVVYVSSTDHTSGSFDLKTIAGKGQYNAEKFYANSKLYQIMNMFSMEARLKKTNVAVYCVHSGAIDTFLKKNTDNPGNWGTIYSVTRNIGKVMNNINKNVTNVMNVALNPKLSDLRGCFFVKGTPLTASTQAINTKEQEVLWRYTLENLKKHLNKDLLEDMDVSLEELGLEEAATEPQKKRK